ncbi:uncharacterized protein LOC122629314 isoform X1 [Vespula pensylvanica]|uniref:uncharacterized protein LOC127063690 n=1 Tax=Vespula vulgaris TaxID=7454 RepID=UPI001CB9E9B7|nr:uncharacterized protein LOC122629314 isoform X1 [Vespula pensylvanica]XP_050849695.1 uncharacterized protein LOC127063690 [Vespula vulgaris]
MAVASDALYNARMASYVSSSAYYGYVPLCTRENMFDHINECNSDSSAPSIASNHFGSAMETDDDGYDYSAASCRLNNHYVIPEASLRRWHEVDNRQQYHCLSPTEQQQAVHGADTTRRRNRKRSNNDSGSTIELKKCRKGSCVYYGTGSAKNYGLATMHYESTSLCLNSINDKTLDHSLVMTESCCRAAGNHSLICNADYRHLSPSNGSKSSDSSVELGELLFETHGCSIYHYYRQQFAKHDIETEF